LASSYNAQLEKVVLWTGSDWDSSFPYFLVRMVRDCSWLWLGV